MAVADAIGNEEETFSAIAVVTPEEGVLVDGVAFSFADADVDIVSDIELEAGIGEFGAFFEFIDSALEFLEELGDVFVSSGDFGVCSAQDDVVESDGEVEIVNAWRGDIDLCGIEVIEGSCEADHVVEEHTEGEDIGVWAEHGFGLVDFGSGVTFSAWSEVEGCFVIVEAFESE